MLATTSHDSVLLRANALLIDMNYITSFTGMTDMGPASGQRDLRHFVCQSPVSFMSVNNQCPDPALKPVFRILMATSGPAVEAHN